MHVKLVLKLKKIKQQATVVKNKINLEGKECVQRALVATIGVLCSALSVCLLPTKSRDLFIAG
jgi:hypothetical protein